MPHVSIRILLVAVSLSTPACAKENGDKYGIEQRADSSVHIADTLPPSRIAGVLFDPTLIDVGDTVGTMIVNRISVSATSDSTLVGSVHFRGNVELVGEVVRHPDPEFKALCFEAHPMSASAIPQWRGDRRKAWFCFSNMAEASEQMMPYLPGQKYEILINEYAVHRGMSDEVNGARLVKVLGRPK